MSRLVGLLSVLLVLALAGSAHADTQTASAGDLTATLTSVPDADPVLRIDVAGATQYNRQLTVGDCHRECGLAPAGPDALTLADADDDGRPEVLVGLYTGGAHCCNTLKLFDQRKAGTWTPAQYSFADADWTLRSIDGKPRFETRDARFGYVFTSFAESAFPLQMLAYQAGRFTDVTASYPDRVRADERRLRKLYDRRRLNKRNDVRGVIAAVIADLRQLGDVEQADHFASVVLNRKDLRKRGTSDVYPSGKHYLQRLNTLLRMLGYIHPTTHATTTQTTTSGILTAALVYTPVGPRQTPEDPVLTISRRGVEQYHRHLTFGSCDVACGLAPTSDDAVHILDADGDGDHDVLVDLYTGGTHCCYGATVLEQTAGRRWKLVDHDFSDARYLVRMHGHTPIFESADARFASQFTYYANSAFPLQYLRLQKGSFHDVTAHYRGALRQDAARLEHLYDVGKQAGSYDARGVIAAIAAELNLAGDGAKADALVTAAQTRGDLQVHGGADELWPAGAQFVTALRTYLRTLGYIRSRS